MAVAVGVRGDLPPPPPPKRTRGKGLRKSASVTIARKREGRGGGSPLKGAALVHQEAGCAVAGAFREVGRARRHQKVLHATDHEIHGGQLKWRAIHGRDT